MKRDDENPTRQPLPPPFAVGTRLRCLSENGTHYGSSSRCGKASCSSDNHPGCWTKIYGKGLEVTIDEVRAGRRGTGRMIDLNDGGDPFIDSTRDGYSVYHIPGTKHGRVIDPDDADNWKVIKPPKGRP